MRAVTRNSERWRRRLAAFWAAASTVSLWAGPIRAEGPAAEPLEPDAGVVSPAPAQPAAAKRTFSLAEALASTERNHPKLAMARARHRSAEALEAEARSAPFSGFGLTGGVGLTPAVFGTSQSSPYRDVAPTDSVGLAWQVRLDGVIPLWTFGKIDALADATSANEEVAELDIQKERLALRFEVRKAYYGLLLARDGRLLLGDVKAQLDSAEQTLTEKIKTGDGDELDLHKLKTFRGELDVRASEAARYETVALTGLRFYTDVPAFDAPDVPLRGPDAPLAPIEVFLEAALRNRPELAQVKEGLRAREAGVRGAQAGFFPDIGVALTLGLGVAPDIDDQKNLFANDPANFFRYGAALAFRWDLDFVPQLARLHQAEAALSEMRSLATFADRGIEAEIRVAHAEAADWERRVLSYGESTRAAKRWLIYVQQGLDLGTVATSELLEPAKAYATYRFQAMNATMELDLALAKLAWVTGWDEVAPDVTAPRPTP